MFNGANHICVVTADLDGAVRRWWDITSSVPPIAPEGSPPPSALARVMRSGLTPERSVTPPAATASPVFTSSKIRTMPWRRVISRTASR
jgi:hypothetical protein